MCLVKSKVHTKEFRKEAPKIVTVWKVLLVRNDRWFSPYRCTDNAIKPGEWLLSNRRWYHRWQERLGTVHNGIHVYLDENWARCYAIGNSTNLILVECTARRKDFVSCCYSKRHAAFTKILIPKQPDWQ